MNSLTTLIKRYVAAVLVCYQLALLNTLSPNAPLLLRSIKMVARYLPLRPREFALTLHGRLEAATSRLEDMVPNMGDSTPSSNGVQSSPGQGMTTADGIGQARGNVQSPRHIEALPPTIDDFDAIINGEVKTFVNMSEEIGGLVAEQVWPQRRWLWQKLEQLRSDTLPTSPPPYYELSPQSANF